MQRALAAVMTNPESDPDVELDAVFVTRARASARDLPSLVQRLLGQLDGARTVAEASRRARIPEAKGLAIIRKLAARGMLRRCRVEPAFTAQEEAFFASEVEPIDECDEPFPTVAERLAGLMGRFALARG